MTQINISHNHGLNLQQARAIALDWAQAAQRDFGIESCAAVDVEGGEHQVLRFRRTGLEGSLRVTAVEFVLEIKLGFFLGAFKERIEAELLKNLEIRLKDV